MLSAFYMYSDTPKYIIIIIIIILGVFRIYTQTYSAPLMAE